MRKLFVVLYEDHDYDYHVKNLLMVADTEHLAQVLVLQAEAQATFAYINDIFERMQNDSVFMEHLRKYKDTLDEPAQAAMMNYVATEYYIVDIPFYYDIIRRYFVDMEGLNTVVRGSGDYTIEEVNSII